ncbi:MAG: hypothetical protein ACK550_16615, partial [Synechococcaceae cyanobacterium]
PRGWWRGAAASPRPCGQRPIAHRASVAGCPPVAAAPGPAQRRRGGARALSASASIAAAFRDRSDADPVRGCGASQESCWWSDPMTPSIHAHGR